MDANVKSIIEIIVLVLITICGFNAGLSEYKTEKVLWILSSIVAFVIFILIIMYL